MNQELTIRFREIKFLAVLRAAIALGFGIALAVLPTGEATLESHPQRISARGQERRRGEQERAHPTGGTAGRDALPDKHVVLLASQCPDGALLKIGGLGGIANHGEVAGQFAKRGQFIRGESRRQAGARWWCR
ncbi:MAG: hypothetical protein IH623_04805 [Verrucomicrobia bacterium]|nr:hypothetical protein [Verrucomicrobiota bacterium]